ncbi:hypothetical protein PPYR_04373 [Photinus pyralis]|uniref:TIR domain-containing protein n=4 Tax=Photinus pyralis TaxID=7054 RepID=A0A5N4AXX7_PHOPY|nr:protein toll [Photinus pyralis]KAB0802187.1 hypothetical protein PPYR_04373 [Photinus pyralis]
MDSYKLLTSIIFFLWTICIISAQNFQCNSSDTCHCTTVQTHYEYLCPPEEVDVVLKVEPQYLVDVQCITDKSNWIDPKLPQLNLGYVEAFKFRNCPIPDSVSTFMDNLGVYKVKSLKADYMKYFKHFKASFLSGLSYLESLTLSNNEIEIIDDDVFMGSSNLTEIDLGSNSIRLTPNLFKYTEKLTLIDLSMNNLDSIPDTLFHNLNNLRVLFLWGSNFTTINGSIFRDLTSLRTLELSHCHIQHLPYDAFYSLKNLTAINLGMNEFETLPANTFAKSTLLETIKMENNPHLQSLPDYLFVNLKLLKTVGLKRCKLNFLPENLFAECTSLQNVSLGHNELKTIPENIFKDLSKLENLDLSDNDIQNLPEKVFHSLENLKRLNLANNKLTTIVSKLFFGLLSLEIINLSNNQLVSIQRYSFQRLTILKEIDLSHNYLVLKENFTTVSPFNDNLQLEKVDLSHNNITRISDDWIISKIHLREIDFSHNQIDNINFRYLITVSPRLQIDLSKNRIKVVNFTYSEKLARSQGNLNSYPADAPNTEVLLGENPVICDCHIFDFVRYLRRDIDPMVPSLVTVKADSLTCQSPDYLKGILVKDLELKMLTCELQQLENRKCPQNCSCIVRPWDKALIINCINASLTHVPELSSETSSIFNHTEIYLANNNITSGPTVYMGYENITVLDLSSNSIDGFQWVPPKLESLILENNNLSFLNFEVLDMLNRSMLKHIYLGRNPWDCNCETANFSQFLLTHLPQQQIDVKNIKCKQSRELLVQLDFKELCPNYRLLAVSVSVSVALMALLVAVLTIVYYRYELEIKVWLYAHNILLWWITEEEIDKDMQYDAFISYSHQDENFVTNDLVPNLEKGPQRYDLCIHIRDWIAGEFIPTQIVNSVEKSRRTIVILSPSFLSSCWGKMEFSTAHAKSVKDGRRRVIVIVYGDVDLEKDLNDELKAYIKTNTYVKWGDPWFWDKLRYALPHSKIKMTRKSQNIMINMNDKLDLLNNIPSTPNSGSTPPALDMEPPLLLKDHPLNFRSNEILTPPAEAGLKPLLMTSTK